MTNQEAIKYLQQLYPNGGHCWLDGQRIEAIGMAVKALQEEPEPKFNKGDKIQSVGKSTGHIYTFTIKEIQDDCYVLDDDKVLTFNMQDNWELVEEPVSEDLGDYINELSKQFPEVSFAKLSRIAVRVAKWQKEQMMAKAIDCEVHQTNVAGIKLDSVEICSDGIMLDNTLYKEGDKVKVIVIKED